MLEVDGCHFDHIFCTFFTKKPFFALRKWKMIFPTIILKTSVLQNCFSYQDTNVCPIWALYQKLWHGNNHIMVIWVETYMCLKMIHFFVKYFFGNCVKTLVYHFCHQLVHINGHHAKGFIFLSIFSLSLIF